MSGVQVHDSGDLRKYRTEVPNLVFELGLSPYALALYMHFKRTAGDDGKCWKSTRRLAEETNISAGKVSQARKELEECNLITVEYPENNNKSITVTITDIWPKNFDHFRTRKTRSQDEQPVHHMNATRSPHERRKEPLEEGSSKETNVSLSGNGEANASTAPMEMGAYGVSELMRRINEARARGATIDSPTNSERKDYGAQFRQCSKDGEDVDRLLMALDYMVAKASGAVENEAKAWCGFRTALDRVREGWRPKRALRVVRSGGEPDPEWDELMRLQAEMIAGAS